MLLVVSEVDWRINPYDTIYRYFFDTMNEGTDDESSSSSSINTANRRRIHDVKYKRRRIHDVFEFKDDDDMNDVDDL